MRRDLLLLREMIDAAVQAQVLVAGHTVAGIEADRLRRDALLWNFTVLGEAATQISDETKSRFDDVAWRNPVRLRNPVVHGYWSVDVSVLHTTASDLLTDFVTSLRDGSPSWRTKTGSARQDAWRQLRAAPSDTPAGYRATSMAATDPHPLAVAVATGRCRRSPPPRRRWTWPSATGSGVAPTRDGPMRTGRP